MAKKEKKRKGIDEYKVKFSSPCHPFREHIIYSVLIHDLETNSYRSTQEDLIVTKSITIHKSPKIASIRVEKRTRTRSTDVRNNKHDKSVQHESKIHHFQKKESTRKKHIPRRRTIITKAIRLVGLPTRWFDSNRYLTCEVCKYLHIKVSLLF